MLGPATLHFCKVYSVYFVTGNAAFLLVSNHFEIYPHDQVKVWHLFASIHIRYCHQFPFSD